MQNATATSIAGQTPSAQNGHAHAHTTPTFSCLPHQRNNVATILGKLLLACAPLADGQTEPQLLLKAAPLPVPLFAPSSCAFSCYLSVLSPSTPSFPLHSTQLIKLFSQRNYKWNAEMCAKVSDRYSDTLVVKKANDMTQNANIHVANLHTLSVSVCVCVCTWNRLEIEACYSFY